MDKEFEIYEDKIDFFDENEEIDDFKPSYIVNEDGLIEQV